MKLIVTLLASLLLLFTAHSQKFDDAELLKRLEQLERLHAFNTTAKHNRRNPFKFNYIDPTTIVNSKYLNDDDFEFYTQATTGATTGDWLVAFLSKDCMHCDDTLPIVEQTAIELQGEVNVAIVDSKKSMLTARRFSIIASPFVVLVRHGKFYAYPFNNVPTAQQLVDFATVGWQESKPRDIKPEPSFKTRMTHKFVEYIMANGMLSTSTIVGFVFLFALVLLVALCVIGCCVYSMCKKRSQKNKKASKKKNDKVTKEDPKMDLDEKKND